MGDSIWERPINCRQLNVQEVYKELSWSGRLQLGLLWLWPPDGGRDPAGRRPGAKEGGVTERTGRCTEDSRNLLPGLSVWVELLCVREFALNGPLFFQTLHSLCAIFRFSEPLKRLFRFSSKYWNLDGCLSRTVASTHTHTHRLSSQEPAAATRGSEPEERMAFKRLSLFWNILCKNHVWLCIIYSSPFVLKKDVYAYEKS